jgi:hypothetical protein
MTAPRQTEEKSFTLASFEMTGSISLMYSRQPISNQASGLRDLDIQDIGIMKVAPVSDPFGVRPLCGHIDSRCRKIIAGDFAATRPPMS